MSEAAKDWEESDNPLRLFYQLRQAHTSLVSRWFPWLFELPRNLEDYNYRQLYCEILRQAIVDFPPHDVALVLEQLAVLEQHTPDEVGYSSWFLSSLRVYRQRLVSSDLLIDRYNELPAPVRELLRHHQHLFARSDSLENILLQLLEGQHHAPVLAHKIRCLFGNPGQKLVCHREWLNESVIGLVRGIVEEQAYDRFPILADALEEAGCQERQILLHCRHPANHSRSCWVLKRLYELLSTPKA